MHVSIPESGCILRSPPGNGSGGVSQVWLVENAKTTTKSTRSSLVSLYGQQQHDQLQHGYKISPLTEAQLVQRNDGKIVAIAHDGTHIENLTTSASDVEINPYESYVDEDEDVEEEEDAEGVSRKMYSTNSSSGTTFSKSTRFSASRRQSSQRRSLPSSSHVLVREQSQRSTSTSSSKRSTSSSSASRSSSKSSSFRKSDEDLLVHDEEDGSLTFVSPVGEQAAAQLGDWVFTTAEAEPRIVVSQVVRQSTTRSSTMSTRASSKIDIAVRASSTRKVSAQAAARATTRTSQLVNTNAQLLASTHRSASVKEASRQRISKLVKSYYGKGAKAVKKERKRLAKAQKMDEEEALKKKQEIDLAHKRLEELVAEEQKKKSKVELQEELIEHLVADFEERLGPPDACDEDMNEEEPDDEDDVENKPTNVLEEDGASFVAAPKQHMAFDGYIAPKKGVAFEPYTAPHQKMAFEDYVAPTQKMAFEPHVAPKKGVVFEDTYVEPQYTESEPQEEEQNTTSVARASSTRASASATIKPIMTSKERRANIRASRKNRLKKMITAYRQSKIEPVVEKTLQQVQQQQQLQIATRSPTVVPSPSRNFNSVLSVDDRHDANHELINHLTVDLHLDMQEEQATRTKAGQEDGLSVRDYSTMLIKMFCGVVR
ncbi:unnamed protein product, partial [Amoebophrya sp. A25]|eukprot:GSA25T00007320001.1